MRDYLVRPTWSRNIWVVLVVAPMLFAASGVAQELKVLTVAPPGAKPAGQFSTVQDAITAAPETGAEIRIQPGEYREVVHIDKPNIQLRGMGTDAGKVVIVLRYAPRYINLKTDPFGVNDRTVDASDYRDDSKAANAQAHDETHHEVPPVVRHAATDGCTDECDSGKQDGMAGQRKIALDARG